MMHDGRGIQYHGYFGGHEMAGVDELLYLGAYLARYADVTL